MQPDYPLIDHQPSQALALAALAALGVVGRQEEDLVLVDLALGAADAGIEAALRGSRPVPRRIQVLAGTILALEHSETRDGIFRFAVGVRGR